MNQFYNRKLADELTRILCVFCLFVHISLLAFFKVFEVTFMVYVNAFSIAFYAVGYFLMAKWKMYRFVSAAAIEIMIHMALATICVGAEPAFEWVLLCLPVCYFFLEFISLEIRGKTSHALVGSIVSIASFYLCEWYLRHFECLYEIPEEVAFVSRQIMSLVIAGVMIFLLYTLVKYVYLTESKLHQKATVDALTGLYNRFEVMDELNTRYERKELDNAWVAMLDIDNFKEMNDAYGHGIGDHVLMKVAAVIREHQEGPLCCRWGGDEFLLSGTYQGREEEVTAYLETICRDIEELTFDMIDEKFKIRVTVGVAFYQNEESVRDWISAADMKLHSGKYSGKNCVMS